MHVDDVAAYLVQKLTGEWITSWSSADPLGLLDLSAFDYQDSLVAAAGLSRDQLPRLVAPGKVSGLLGAEVAGELGLPADLPLVAGAGQSAGLGSSRP